MKTVRKRILSYVLAVVMVVSALPLGGCAGLFSSLFDSSVYHGEVDFSDMEYVHLDTGEFDDLAEEISSLMGKARNASKVLDKFDRMWEIYNDFYNQYSLAYIYNTMDVTNTYYAEEVLYVTNTSTVLFNKLLEIAQEILASPCGKRAKRYWGDEFVAQLEETDLDTPEQIALLEQESALLAQYRTASVASYTDAVEKNAALGGIYLELLTVRDQLAKSYGYEQFADFAYDNLYYRDYTPEDAQKLNNMVKEVAASLPSKEPSSEDVSAWERLEQQVAGLSSVQRLDAVKSFLPELSEQFVESFQYLLDYHLYDIEYRENKMDISYTTVIPEYNAPFLFSQPYGGLYDIQTIVHEFGHYNAYYHGAASTGTNEDIAEIHSQTMELLFLPYYSELFGEEGGQLAAEEVVSTLLSGFIQGCLLDEFQQEVYQNPDISLEEINQLFLRLSEEYGLVNDQNRMDMAYRWVEIAHNFIAPCYYISYAVSAFTSLEIWSLSQEGEKKAQQKYEELLGYGDQYMYLDLLKACNLSSPFTEGKVEQLLKNLLDFSEIGR